MRLQDKVAPVTGANSGIGKATAERFAAEGRLQHQSAAAMDLAYERGYRDTPEELSLTNELPPHLATELGSWE